MSWQQLTDIVAQNREERRQEAQEPPVACPIDGRLLDVHPNGTRNCPLGNFRWTG